MSDDPWERRERVKSRRAGVHRKRSDWDLFAWVSENSRALLVLLAVALLLAAEIPTLGGTIRSGLVVAGTGLLIGIAALLRTWQRSARQAISHPPTLAIIALVAWCIVVFFLSPNRPQAGAELLRIIAGATAYFLLAFGLSASERGVAAGGILTLACSLSIVDFVRMSQLKFANSMREFIGSDYSFLGTHENVGSLLALLVPIAVSLALSQNMEEKRRWAAYAATLTLTFAWLAARCRSAWVGGGVALIVLAILLWRSPKTKRARPRNARERLREVLGSPLPILIGATVFMAVGGGFATFLSQRAATVATVQDDSSLQIRIAMWEGAARMSAQKPYLGWGLGAYPILQGWWTHLGASDFEVLRDGATHENIAHNYYVQWAAEAGVVGLALHLTALCLWALTILNALRRPLSPIDQPLAIGAVAAVLGASVDALASPAYQFHGVYVVMWLLMGLGSAATAPRDDEAPARGRTFLPIIASVVLGIGLATLVPLWGKKLGDRPKDARRGNFALFCTPAGPRVAPGSTVTLRAQFTDGSGKRQNTAPGTTWDLPSERETGALKGGIGKVTPQGQTYVEAILRVTMPDKPGGIVQIMARFTDRAGRAYIASEVFLLKESPK